MNGTRQKIQYLLALEPMGRGETPVSGYQGTEPFVAKPTTESPAAEQLMEEVCERENLVSAWKRVRRNKGSPGVDGMTIDDGGRSSDGPLSPKAERLLPPAVCFGPLKFFTRGTSTQHLNALLKTQRSGDISGRKRRCDFKQCLPRLAVVG